MSARPALWGEGLGNDPSYPAPAKPRYLSQCYSTSEVFETVEPSGKGLLSFRNHSGFKQNKAPVNAIGGNHHGQPVAQHLGAQCGQAVVRSHEGKMASLITGQFINARQRPVVSYKIRNDFREIQVKARVWQGNFPETVPNLLPNDLGCRHRVTTPRIRRKI